MSHMPFADPEKNLDWFIRDADLIGRRAKGHSVAEIAAATGVPERTVAAAIARAAEQVRDGVRSRVEEAFATQDRRLEMLYVIVQKQIDAMKEFDERLIRSAVLILDRQSKLLDLDRAKRGTKGAAGTVGNLDWLETASHDDLYKIATEQYGLKIPEPFRCTTTESESTSTAA